MRSLREKAKSNQRSAEAEVREMLASAAAIHDKNRRKAGTELAGIGRRFGALDLQTTRELKPIDAADFS